MKARLCAQDFAHLQKRDDLYSPTPSVTALRQLLSLASSRGHRLRIGDFSTAFLHAPMDIETFVRPPQVYAKQGVIWRLRKALYGMRRAPKLFFNLLHEILSELGMQSLRSEPTFYFKSSLSFLVHVDDPLVAGTDEDIEWIFRELGQRMKFMPGPRLEIGKPVKYLGKMYTMTEHGFKIRHCDTFLDRIVFDLGLDGCKPALTPGCEQLKPGRANEKASWLSPLDTEQTYRNRKLVGMLRFIAPERPDLLFEIGVLSQRLSSPTGECWARLRRLGKYLAGTTRARLFVSRPQHTSNKTRQIVVWTDSDYAGDKQTGNSTSCALVFCDGTLVHGHSRRQTVVATSSAGGRILQPRCWPSRGTGCAIHSAGTWWKLRSSVTPAQPEPWPTEWVWGEPSMSMSNTCGYNKSYNIVLPELLLCPPMKTSQTLGPNVCLVIDFKSCVATLD